MEASELGKSLAASRVRELVGHKMDVISLAFNCMGTVLSSGSHKGEIKLWSVGMNAREVASISAHPKSVQKLVWNPKNPRELASTSHDNTVCISDAKTKKVFRRIATPGPNICLAWSPDGTTLAVGDQDNLVSLIDAKTGKTIATHKHSCDVNDLAFTPSGDHIALATDTFSAGVVDIFDFTAGFKKGPAFSLNAHSAGCLSVRMNGRNRMAVGSFDGLASVWDLSELICLSTVDRHDNPVNEVSFSPCGEFLISASEGLIDVADSKGCKVHSINTRKASASAIVWHPVRHMFAYALEDHWDKRAEGLIRVVGSEA